MDHPAVSPAVAEGSIRLFLDYGGPGSSSGEFARCGASYGAGADDHGIE